MWSRTGRSGPGFDEWLVLYRSPQRGTIGSTGSANRPRLAGQEERDLGKQDEEHEADEQRQEVGPVRLEVLPDGDVGEAQRHQEPHADGRQEETDAHRGGEHDVEVDRVNADLLGDRVWIETGVSISPRQIARGPRVGIDYAEAWVRKPWRFWIRDNPFVSKPNKIR